MTEDALKAKKVRAKLFLNGRSQAVRLPKEFRFEGKEVRIGHVNGGVLLEPVQPASKPWKTVEELYSHLAAHGGDPILPDGREQPEMQERDWSVFDQAE
jgi:antitoxin VapB